MSAPARLWLFLREAFEPVSHFGFTCLWQGSLLGLLAVQHRLFGGVSGPLRVDLWLLLAFFAVFGVLFVIRALDEVKDLAYDREFNPERPLARGAVSGRDLWRWSGIVGLLTLGIGLVLAVRFESPWILIVLVVDLVWIAALVEAERGSETVAENLLVNLVVTYPVNVLLVGFAWVYFCAVAQPTHTVGDLELVAVHAFVFLHFEFARKLVWPTEANPGQKSYVAALGPVLASVATLAFAALPAVIVLRFRPWELPDGPFATAIWALLLIPALGAVNVARFWLRRGEKVKLAPLASLTLVLYYVVLLAATAAGAEVDFVLSG